MLFLYQRKERINEENKLVVGVVRCEEVRSEICVCLWLETELGYMCNSLPLLSCNFPRSDIPSNLPRLLEY
jgi:hypothetical protein